MTDNKIKIPEAKFDINLKFYFFLKYLLKTKLTDAQICKILVADEIYQNTSYLKSIDGVYSSKDLTIKTLKSLANNYNYPKVILDK